MSLLRTSMDLGRYIRAPIVQENRYGSMCQLCAQVVDSEAIVEGYPGEENEQGQVTRQADTEWCRVLVRHHGAEEVRTIEFGSRLWGPMELSRWMARTRWFDPMELLDQGKLQK